LAKAFALLYPATLWKELGYDHPFGEEFYSLRDYIPMQYSREQTLAAIEQVPDEVLRAFYMLGSAEDIIKRLEAYRHQGLDHMILWNSTGMFDLDKTRSSFKIMKEVLSYVKG
jgi:phthiodiolone/phenolphthiodiolone dimycocerosates ketoreductase